MSIELVVGSFVRHRNLAELGIGKVFCVGYQYVLVGFIAADGGRSIKRIPKSFVESAQGLEPDRRFDGWAVQTTSDCKEAEAPVGKLKKPPRPPQWTLAQAYDRFLKDYPAGFTGDQYVGAERTWKLAQGDLWRQQFTDVDLRALVSSDPLKAGELVTRVVQTKPTSMLAIQSELPRMVDALRTAPAPYLLALADWLEQPEPTADAFNAMADALEGLPTSKAKASVLTWPTLTLVPFLVRPEIDMFLKPGKTKKVAQMLGVDLLYTPRPSWDGYKRLLEWSEELLSFLKPHGARDLVDVQSFIWTIGEP